MKQTSRMAKDKEILSLEAEIERLEGEARSKDDFIRITNHELRTPLDVIRGNLDMVLKGETGDITAETREYLVDALFGADRLTRLVNDMLDITRISAGRMRFELKDFDICETLQTIEKEFRPIATEKHLVLCIDCPKDVPDIHSDRSRIFQIVGNMIGNALKFTPRGGSITIRVRNDKKGIVPDTIIVSVIDTGIGLAPKDLKKLFKQFPNIEKKIVPTEKGTGLGLNLVWHLIKALGGEIWAESPGEGRGTTFSFRLPIANTERARQLDQYHKGYLNSYE